METERQTFVRKLGELKDAYAEANYEVPALLCSDLLAIMQEWGTRYRKLAQIADEVFAAPTYENEPIHEEALTEVCAAVRHVLDVPGPRYSTEWLDLTVMEIVGVFLSLGWRLGA